MVWGGGKGSRKGYLCWGWGLKGGVRGSDGKAPPAAPGSGLLSGGCVGRGQCSLHSMTVWRRERKQVQNTP